MSAVVPTAADLGAAASRQLSEVQRPSNHVIVTPARGPWGPSKTDRLSPCPDVGPSNAVLPTRQNLCALGHLVWMAGMAVGPDNLPTGSCRQDRVSIDMETRSSITSLPASGAMRSVAAMPTARHCRTTNRNRLSGRRLTSTRATSCDGSLILRMWRSAGAVRFNSTQ